MFPSFATKSELVTGLHHAHYLSQSKYGLDHTFLNVVDFNISGLEIVNLLFIKKILEFEYVGL
jgi:hypothetical protein